MIHTDTVVIVVNGAAIVGVVSFLGIAFPKMESLHKVVAVLIVGAVLPYLPDLGPSVEGIKLALASAGFYKVAIKAGGQ